MDGFAAPVTATTAWPAGGDASHQELIGLGAALFLASETVPAAWQEGRFDTGKHATLAHVISISRVDVPLATYLYVAQAVSAPQRGSRRPGRPLSGRCYS